MMEATSTIGMLVAGITFLACYTFILWNRFPAVLVVGSGAALLVASGILTQGEAVGLIDWNTIGLLCGMMMIVHVLRGTGLFEFMAIKAIKLSRGKPIRILFSLALVTAFLSALLDNVTTVLVVVPITFAMADALRVDARPYLVAEILLSNIGGTATLIGDPPNLLIGSRAGLTFLDFVWNDGPVVVVVVLVTFLVLWLVFRRQLRPQAHSGGVVERFDESRAITDHGRLRRSLFVFSLVILGFVTHALHHVDLATVAIGGAFVLLLITGRDPEEVLREVEWTTLFFFAGLFILIGGLQKTGIILALAQRLLGAAGGDVSTLALMLVGISGVAASLLSAVPYTATMIPVIETLARGGVAVTPLWWALSLGACLGANGTPIGSAAGLVVISLAAKNGMPISFWQYTRLAFPIMLLTVAVATAYVYLRYL